MRTVTDHIVEGDSVNHQLTISVLDGPGHGGACHEYRITVTEDPSARYHPWPGAQVRFQNGPIKEFGVNGITQEALLAIVIDRLRSFQAGPFACVPNANALERCVEALEWLQERTKQRIARGVEGTTQK